MHSTPTCASVWRSICGGGSDGGCGGGAYNSKIENFIIWVNEWIDEKTMNE